MLKTRPGYITLEGYQYGFIGGASVNLDENTLGFFVDISFHPDNLSIIDFCKSHNVNAVSLCKGIKPVDICGAFEI